jgi:hypothetical protein
MVKPKKPRRLAKAPDGDKGKFSRFIKLLESGPQFGVLPDDSGSKSR